MTAPTELDERALEAACAATVLGEDADGKPVHLEPQEAATAIRAYLSALPASEAGWREITEDEFPPYDTEVLMGFWESWPSQKWVVEYGLYGSTKGGWISGSVTHWLPSSFLPSAPDRRAA